MSKYVCDDGTHKYEAVLTVRVRFNINPNRGDNPAQMAAVIGHHITNFLNSSEELNTPNLGEKVVWDGRHLTKITMANTELECWDNASQRSQRSNIHKIGYYTTRAELVNAWNRELRVLPKKDYPNMVSFDTSENAYSTNDSFYLPTLPAGLLGDELLQNVYEVTDSITKERNKFIRKTATNLIEGLFEDGLPVPTEDKVKTDRPRTYRDYVNNLQSEQPDPF